MTKKLIKSPHEEVLMPVGPRPKAAVKKEFGRRVYEAMTQKGWNQSELARRASDRGGINVSRDDISRYVRGVSVPDSDAKLKALAEVLSLAPDKLLPNYTPSVDNGEEMLFEMKAHPSQPGMAWIRFNRLVTFATATKIAELLQNDNAPADRKGSR